MRVNDRQLDRNTGLGATEAAAFEKNEGTSEASRHASDNRDSVTLSDLTALLARVSGEPTTGRTEHVSRIAGDYRAGLYVVNDLALAGALIDRGFEG
jgi:hypothetical protein